MVRREESINASSGPQKLFFFVAFVLGFSLVGYMSYRIFNQSYKQNQINEEIAALQEEVEKLNQENQDLGGLISYLETDDFKEKEAKEKLNLVKEGEEVVLVKEREVAVKGVSREKDEDADIVIDQPNYYWWWHYFFALK